MRRRRTIAFLSLATLTLSLLAAPSASAATANARCSKAGQSTKIGGKNYVCAQNPTLKSKKLRWTLKDCLSANTAYLTSVKSLAETESSNAKILETIDASIKSLETQLPLDKTRAATATENATRYRALATQRTNDAAVKLAAAKAAGLTEVPTTWLRPYQATIIDGQLSAAEFASLVRSWNVTEQQASLAIQYFAAQIQSSDYTKYAESYERTANTYLKTESTLNSVKTQRETTLQTQKEILSFAQSDVKSTLKVRNASCRTK